MEVFLAIPEPPKVQLEMMLLQINHWQNQFAILPAPRLKDVLNENYLHCSLHICLEYLKLFLDNEEPDPDTCVYMNLFLKYLEVNYAGLNRFYPADVASGLQDQMDLALQNITSSHPEVLDGVEE